MVDRPSRRGHDDVDAGLQRPDLAQDRLAAVDRQHPRAEFAAVAVDRLGHLDGELAGRDKDERLRVPPAAVEALQQRQRERGRLAGAGGRLPQQVAPGQQRRDRLALDRRRLLVAQRVQRPLQLRAQGQVGEAGRLLLGASFRGRVFSRGLGHAVKRPTPRADGAHRRDHREEREQHAGHPVHHPHRHPPHDQPTGDHRDRGHDRERHPRPEADGHRAAEPRGQRCRRELRRVAPLGCEDHAERGQYHAPERRHGPRRVLLDVDARARRTLHAIRAQRRFRTAPRRPSRAPTAAAGAAALRP